jgi:8-oxo-dGTP pyrophosphatase MutT (NUDIX family)/flavodoxin
MKTVVICPKAKGNTFTVCSYAARETGADLKILSRDTDLNLSDYDGIIFGSGVYAGKLHKSLSVLLGTLKKDAVKPGCRLYLFLTWFGRGHSDSDAFREAGHILSENGLLLEPDTASCFGAGFGFIRTGHPDEADLRNMLTWVKRIMTQQSAAVSDDGLPFITHIDDFVYPPAPIHTIRDTARGIILKDGRIALMHIVGTDKFGVRDHWETPGGGIETGETPEAALRREIQEELGCTIDNIRPIGRISNDYNLIGRCDRASFFLAEAGDFSTPHYTDEEKTLFKNVDWIPASEIVSRYENYSVTAPDGTKTGVGNCGRIIHRRDLIMIKRALDMIHC